MSDVSDPSRPSATFRPTLEGGSDTPVGPFRQWVAHSRGWPRSVPVRVDLQRRVRHELSRTSVGEDVVARMKRAGLASIGMGAAWGALVGGAPGLTQIAIMQIGPSPAVVMVALLAMLMVQWVAIRRLGQRILGPRTRAGLRREGIDCCVKCGHLMGAGGPADSCPECGFDHVEFPLGWQPGSTPAAERTAPKDD